MRSKLTCLISHRAGPITAALALIILIIAPARAQDDTKDKEIARLKAITDAQQKQLDILAQQQKVIQERLLADIESLTRSIKDRDAVIEKLQLEKKRLQIDVVNLDTRVKASEIRTQALLKQTREMMDKMRLQPNDLDPAIRNPLTPQVPLVDVNGKIQKIDGDLIQISVGAEQGLSKNHTLEVYRLRPDAKYLGMIRLIDVSPTQSVGRLVTAGGSAPPALQVGDLVASRLTSRPEKTEPKKN